MQTQLPQGSSVILIMELILLNLKMKMMHQEMVFIQIT